MPKKTSKKTSETVENKKNKSVPLGHYDSWFWKTLLNHTPYNIQDSTQELEDL